MIEVENITNNEFLYNVELQNKIYKIEKENKQLKEDLERDIYARDCLAKQSISKDKIRDKIKQLEKSPFVLYGSTIEILKELIGE